MPTRSAFAVAAATLVAAAVVAPLRRRVQRLVDKRFNRAHYDAAALVDGFANQLRESTAAGLVSAQLTQAVARAVDPTHVSVWVRGDRLADAGPLA